MNFKGLNRDGKWIHGCGIVPIDENHSCIVNSRDDLCFYCTVENDTVCVGSRIKDSFGVEVFENDIIQMSFGKDDYYYVVKYDSRCGQYYLLNSNVRFDVINDLSVELKFYVVGNALKDTELLNRALKRNNS